MENLEKTLKDPLAFFDYFNKKAWKDPNDPEVAQFIADARAKITEEPNKSHQYNIVVAYMLSLREKVSGDVSDLLSKLKEINKKYK